MRRLSQGVRGLAFTLVCPVEGYQMEGYPALHPRRPKVQVPASAYCRSLKNLTDLKEACEGNNYVPQFCQFNQE